MMESRIRPGTRQLGVALTLAAAILGVPTPGSAGPITASNIESFAVRGVREIFMTDLFGTPDNDGRGAYSEAAQQGDTFAVLHDDLPERAGTSLASPADLLSGGRVRSVGLGASDTSVPTSVPEPNTLILFGYGLVGAAMWTRRRIGAGRS